MKFTLVSTVYNEISRLNNTIADIEAQTLLPNEIIITDAGSSDGTYERLQEWSKESNIDIVILQEKGCNVARGRNLAIQEAKYDIIASTDFGCRFHPEWLTSIITPFKDKSIQVVGGAFTIQNDENKTLAAKSDFVLQNGYPVVMDQYFSVSSRSIAYYKNVWEKCGQYPEWLTLAADDTILWRMIKHHQFNYVFVSHPYVFWLRHKTNKAFAREAFRYGLGDGEAHINARNAVSHFVETTTRYALLLFLIASPWIYQMNMLLLLLIFPLFFGLRSYINVYQNWKKNISKEINLLVLINGFFQTELSRFQYLKGYRLGYFSKRKEVLVGRATLAEKGIE